MGGTAAAPVENAMSGSRITRVLACTLRYYADDGQALYSATSRDAAARQIFTCLAHDIVRRGLPAPLGPTTAVTDPGRTSRSSFRSAPLSPP